MRSKDGQAQLTKMSKFYITTTLPYVNAEPHVGTALEFIQADVIARYHRLLGEEVVFNTGTDEHGLKIYRKAVEEGREPKEYVDEYAARFKKVLKALNISFTNFIRTTDEEHQAAAQEFWNRCLQAGDIYKAKYKIKYCVGCELEKTDSELKDDKCPIHPNLKIEEIEEENYFFKFSKFQKSLLEMYKNNPEFVLPDFRFNEIKRFVEGGLKDFSVSRLKSKMPWGVDVPGDPDQVMFVWFDALVNYISTLGWPKDEAKFKEYWPGTQIAGKDNLRQQSAIWQAMLLSAGLPTSKQVLIHGFVTVDGEKISKSLGNTIDPLIAIEKYGVEPLRYYLLREIPSGDDGDFSYKKLEERYNGDLANGLGNLVQRVATLIDTKMDGEISFTADMVSTEMKDLIYKINEKVEMSIYNFKLHEGLGAIWDLIKHANIYFNDHKPWETVKTNPEHFNSTLINMVFLLHHIAGMLSPFMPETASKMPHLEILGDAHKLLLKKGQPLFPRLK